MKKNKKIKLAYGGSPMEVESPMQALFDMIRNSEESAFEASNDPTVAGMKMLGTTMQNTGMSMAGQGLSQSKNLNGLGKFFNKNMGGISSGVNMAQSFAFGGTVPSEIEGEEVVELPNGQVKEAKGPSHEKGGIDMMLPGGAEVFSKRIKIDGVTIADRKKKRVKREVTLEELLKNNGTDNIVKNSLKRTKQNNEKEEQLDNNVQEVVGTILNPPKEEFAYGGTADGNPVLNINTLLGMMGINPSVGGTTDIEEVVIQGGKPKALKTTFNDTLIEPTVTPVTADIMRNPIEPLSEGTSTNKFDWSSLAEGLDTGDLGNAVGMAGNIYSAFAPMKNTLKNRAGDTPNINPYANFGVDALSSMDDAGSYVDQMKDEALSDIELSKQGTINRNNNSARGINTLRALNMATDSASNNAKSDVYNNTAGQMMNLLTQKAQMENVQDQFVMKGEGDRDMADRMDRDNFFSQMAQDISTKGRGIQQIGKDLNQTKQNEVAMNLINQLSKYGITVDKKGNLTYKKTKD